MVLFKYLTLPSLHVWPQGDVHHCWLSLCGTRFFSLITLEVFIVNGVLEKTLESLLNCKEIKPVNPKGNQTWIFIGKTDAEAEALILESTHWKRPWCWDRLRVGGERDDRGWDDWMASLTQWTWVWSSSRRWWRRAKPGMLQSTESQSQTWLSDWTTSTYIHTQ